MYLSKKISIDIGRKATEKLDLISSNENIVMQKEANMTKVRKKLKRRKVLEKLGHLKTSVSL